MKTNKRGPPSNGNPSAVRIRPSIALSQNFLCDGNIAKRLIQHSSIEPDDVVLEIGAGKGEVTVHLARYSRQVLAVEKDSSLAVRLSQRFAGADNVVVITADFMDVELPTSPYKVFANIPYNATAAIISKLTDTPNPPADVYLVVQVEAAHKFMGIPKETLSALMLKPWFKLSILHHFDRRDFVPVPDVDSVLLRIQPRMRALLSPSVQNAYRDFVAFCFTHGSPSLYRLLERLMGREALNITASMLQIDRTVTPTALDFEIWLCLFCQFWQHARPHERRQILGSEQRLKCEQSRLHKWHRTR